MISIQLGDLTKVKEMGYDDVDYIVNASNGQGPMGSGIAGAIRRAGGTIIQDEAFEVCKKLDPQPAEIYVTSAGSLPYKKIIHVVTMKNPGGVTSYDIVKRGLQNLIKYCNENNIEKIGLPAFGTGVGKLNKAKIAKMYIDILEPVKNIEFVIVDIDEDFIGFLSIF